MEDRGAFNKSEKSFDEQDCAPVEAFIAPTDLPQAKCFEVPLHVVKVFNDMIRKEWDGHRADLDLLNISAVLRHLCLDNAEQVWRNLIIYAERRGWRVDRKQYPYPNLLTFYRFTPK